MIPVGREVELSVTSNDVIHSFWIPALNGKSDAVPGQHHPWKLEADKPGIYRGQCTEFCGLSHANMRMLVRAVPQRRVRRLGGQPAQAGAAPPAAGSEAEQGKQVFEAQLCSSCHLINGVNNDKVGGSDTGVKSPARVGHRSRPDPLH